jgi:hypothetical protein
MLKAFFQLYILLAILQFLLLEYFPIGFFIIFLLFFPFNFIFNYLNSKRYGRKRTTFFFIVANSLANTLLVFFTSIPDIDDETQQILYGLCRFLQGSTSSVYATGIVLAIEIVGPKYRLFANSFISLNYVFGEIIILILGYYIRDYETFFKYVGLVTTLFLLTFW